MNTGGGGGEDAHESERSLLPFSGYALFRHLCHIDYEKAEAMGGLIYILYDRANGRISGPDLTRIFIALGGDAGGGGGGVGVA